MWTFVIIISIICAVFFLWASMDYKKRKSENNKCRTRPRFRTERDLEEYGKPMKDEDQSSVDLDDA